LHIHLYVYMSICYEMILREKGSDCKAAK